PVMSRQTRRMNSASSASGEAGTLASASRLLMNASISAATAWALRPGAATLDDNIQALLRLRSARPIRKVVRVMGRASLEKRAGPRGAGLGSNILSQNLVVVVLLLFLRRSGRGDIDRAHICLRAVLERALDEGANFDFVLVRRRVGELEGRVVTEDR